MDFRHEDQQQRKQLLTIVDRGTAEQLFIFLQKFHRKPFRSLGEVLSYEGVIDDQIDFIDCTGTKYNVTPLIIASGKGSYEKSKILLVHGANPNKQCSTGDTALNLAVHRQKYHVTELLLRYNANPNIPNQAGKTALHRACVSYIDENANHVRSLLQAGADLTVEDRNQRIPLDEAVIANKPEIVNVLLSHNRNLVQHSHRAAIIAARLGHDKCLEVLLENGMDPNISDRTRTAPLHVAVRSLKSSTARLLVAYGADQNMANSRGETPMAIAEYLPADQQQVFLNVLIHTPKFGQSDLRRYPDGTVQGSLIPYVYPLLHSRHNWTLDSEEFRSRTEPNSSVQNLLDVSSGTYWCSTLSKDAWVIFDLKRQYNISGMRIIGCDNQSTPRNGHIDVSNAFNGPWLKVKDFTCPFSQGNTNDILFDSLKTRFIRVFISDNYGGDDIRIQGIGFFGVDTRLVNLLGEYGLERSLQTLLANGINDVETLDEKQDEILNSTDKYLGVNDHFQFLRLTESLRSPKLTVLQWFNPPQQLVTAGEKIQTFSAAGDEGVSDRVRLEEKLENNPQTRAVLLKDLEPIQGRSLVDFPDYIINDPGRYKVRIVSVESPDIHTTWHDILVNPKPPSTATQTSGGIISHRPTSTTPTDFGDDLIGDIPDFSTSRPFRPTPGPFRDTPRFDTDDEEFSDSVHPTSDRHRHKSESPRRQLIDEGTQSEEKSTRNVGTMHEPIKTRNFGNEAQPQSSATQTSFLIKDKKQKPKFTYIERADETNGLFEEHYPDERISHPTQYDPYYDHGTRLQRRSVSTSPIDDYLYRGHLTTDYRRPENCHRYTPPLPPYYQSSSLDRLRRPTHRQPRTRRSPMLSQGTDTSFDAIKQKQHAGVQSEPRPTKEKGTTPSFPIKRPSPLHRPTVFDSSIYPQRRSPVLHEYPRTRIYRREEEEEEEEEEETPSMHDQSTMAELLVSFDHYTQCDPPPFMADRYIQTSPRLDQDRRRRHDSFDFIDEPDIRQLPRGGSISISQPVIIQPDSLPRARRRQHSPTRPKRDGLDYTGNILELPLHHAHQQRTNPIQSSPLLNIGTEHVIRQSAADEFAVPFETKYVKDSYDSFRSKPRHDYSSVISTLPSPRTHFYTNNSVRQSRTNGNFYLSPARSLNSSFRVDIAANES